MKSVRTPLLVFVLLYVCFGIFVWLSVGALPPRVATHFGAGGQPNGWMSRQGYLRFTLIFGLAFPLFPALLLSLTRFLPDSCINLPNRDYWLAPERRKETFGFFSRQFVWLSCAMICFVSAMHFLVVHANGVPAPRLPGSWVFAAVVCFILAVLVWISRLLLHFYAPRGAS
jgi:serine/threonine-protein kinase